MRPLDRVSHLIDRLAVWAGNISAFFIVITALSVFYEIVSRTFFGKPTKWVLETSTYLTISAAFFGASYVTSKGQHVIIDALTSQLRRHSREALDFTVHIIAVVFLVLFVYSSVQLLAMSRATGAASPGMRLPIYLPQSMVLLGGALLLLQVLKITIAKGVSLVKGKASAAPEEPSSTPPLSAGLDKPVIVILLFAAGVTAGFLLLKAGGSLVHLGVLVLLFVFLFSGMPVFLGLATIASMGFFVLIPGLLNSQKPLALAGYSALDKFELVAIPLFILGGNLIGAGKISDMLFDLFQVFTRRIPGSLAVASILSCAIFAAMSGSGISTALTLGIIAIPAMVARGYDKRLAIGAVASAGTLGILIPPSIPMILYGALTGVSVGKMFIGGILPGILIVVLLSMYVVARCWKDPRYRATETVPTKEKLRVLRRAFPVLFIPVFVMGSIYTGMATPTEAASVLVIIAIIFGVAYRQLNRTNVWRNLRDSMTVSAAVLMIFVGAKVLTVVTTRTGISEWLISFCTGSELSPWAVIVLINAVIILLGMIFESGALFVVLTPILYPLVVALGYDPLWFGILFVINIEVAQISPPVGIVIFALQAALKEKSVVMMRSVIPFCLVLILGLILVGIFPALATWLPAKMLR